MRREGGGVCVTGLFNLGRAEVELEAREGRRVFDSERPEYGGGEAADPAVLKPGQFILLETKKGLEGGSLLSLFHTISRFSAAACLHAPVQGEAYAPPAGSPITPVKTRGESPAAPAGRSELVQSTDPIEETIPPFVQGGGMGI